MAKARTKLPRKTKGQLLADLRDVFCLYDLEIVYHNTSDIAPEFLEQNEEGEFMLRLRPFSWTKRRAAHAHFRDKHTEQAA